MNILAIGWGYRPYQGGGTVQVTEDILEELSVHGHEVHYLCGGKYDLFMRPYIKRWEKKGFTIHEVRNSPNFPAGRHNPLDDISQKELEGIFKRVLEKLQPDIVHVHDILGWPVSIIRISKNREIPIVVKFGNYWPLCTRLSLFDYQEQVCTDFNGGFKCVKCMSGKESESLRKLKKMMHWMLMSSNIRKPAKVIYKNLRGYFSNLFSRKRETSPGDNKVELAKKYQKRRSNFIKELKKANLLTPSSNRAKDILVKYGLDSNNYQVINPTTKTVGQIEPKEVYNRDGPITFGFIGGISIQKGIDVLLEAFSLLDTKKARLRIYGRGSQDTIEEIEGAEGKVKYCGAYKQSELTTILGKIDVGVLPSICEDVHPLVGIEYLAGKVPIIGSNIGGIPEYITDGINGFLFQAGNANELRSTMKNFIEKPRLIGELSKNIKPVKKIGDHTREIEEEYSKLLEGRTNN